ncbi:hypothetical protein HZH66_002212 [Vespula vulgaris]|uniref:Uncharacterized protein n=1 Tax=Vespula vulgaris TaxID=7454 RepID=A0A834NG14_VESVU|nr:hypothetical protein HZH66_002212 [Vespula vulgaris]
MPRRTRTRQFEISKQDLLKEISTLRIEQLDELENIFDYLEDNRNLKDYQGEKSARLLSHPRRVSEISSFTSSGISSNQPTSSLKPFFLRMSHMDLRRKFARGFFTSSYDSISLYGSS